MTQTRYNDLKTALYERIKEKGPCDDLTLLTWLVSRLDEWVERLETGAFSCERIMQTDFFGMFKIGIEVIDEVKTTSEFKQVFPEWDCSEFKNAVTWLEQTREREDVSLVDRTYQKFKNSFAAISGENSDPEKEPGTRIDSKPSRTDGKQSANQGGPPKIELDGPTQVEWWPRSKLLSPVEVKTSRVFLSLAILFLLGSLIFFADFLFEESVLVPAHFGALEGRRGPENLTLDLPALFLFLSVLFFAIWTVYRLWFKVLRKSQE
jgi:hypothetical protein